jgi:CheY-like chemotaxis protein
VTKEAISAILEHLCNEARNSVHATFGAMEFEIEGGSDSRRASAAIGRASADQLLRSIDDVRELISSAAPAPATLEEFDLERCACEVIEALNLASGKRRSHMVLESLNGPLLLTQDRKATEQMLTRVLDAAFKLTLSSDVHVKISAAAGGTSVRLGIHARDAELAIRLARWLNADPDQAVLEDPSHVSFELAVMVAGKCLRALGGTAELDRDSAGHCAVALSLPSQAQRIGSEDAPGRETQPEALNILVAEDFDDSFTLTALVLQNEHVWRARDGREALHMIQKQRFDLVLMDVHMPGMDGYSAIGSMRDWETQTGNARTPIVVLSSDDLDTQRRSAAQCGCSGFLRKPLCQKDLTSLLDRLKQSRMPL